VHTGRSGATDVDDLTVRLGDVAAALADTERALLTVEPVVAHLGGGTAGRPGELGRALHDRWVAALAARAREAADAARRVGELSDALHTTTHGYADADDLAARRLLRES
jgi:hypothetical protein